MNVLMGNLYKWFHGYVSSYYSEDRDIQENIVLKETHTIKVAQNSIRLASELGLSQGDQQLAEIIGLLHDIGRFKQYYIYRTFRDSKSENHALLGLSEIKNLDLIQLLVPEDRECLTFSIGNHNAISIPANASPRQQLFARIVRDADKLDIFRVLAPTLIYSDGQGYSEIFAKSLLTGEQCDYSCMKTADDRKLIRLSWIYDINYSWTMKQIIKEGYVDEILKTLPDNEKLRYAASRLKEFMKVKAFKKSY
ncbi:HD domain-containing protein [Dendrosporobacter sp. 1207_IL3150]|uniref:HD domain-containing protein n=1 Tax=Dendrosporobacter sp. 1207_IL3150 TaxID=3084054 RepID=UPI002FDA0905